MTQQAYCEKFEDMNTRDLLRQVSSLRQTGYRMILNRPSWCKLVLDRVEEDSIAMREAPGLKALQVRAVRTSRGPYGK